MNWIKNNRANIALTITSIVLALIVIDVVMYVSPYKYLLKITYPRYYYAADEELGFDLSKNFATTTHYFADASYPIWTNSLGCFDEEYRGETPYIYLAGDSFTWGFTPFGDKWGTLLEKDLGIRIVKCGVGGYGTREELLLTERHLSLLPQPKLIIVGYTAGNDILDDLDFPGGTVYKGYLVRNRAKNGVTEAEAQQQYTSFDTYCTYSPPTHPIFQKIKCWLNNHSVVYNLAQKLRPLIFPINQTNRVETTISDEMFQKHLEDIRGFKELADKEGSKLLFVLIQGADSRVKEFMDKEGIMYLDISPYFDQSDSWKHDGHWNIKGNQLAEQLVSKFIIEKNFIKIPEKTY